MTPVCLSAYFWIAMSSLVVSIMLGNVYTTNYSYTET